MPQAVCVFRLISNTLICEASRMGYAERVSPNVSTSGRNTPPLDFLICSPPLKKLCCTAAISIHFPLAWIWTTSD